MDDASPKYCFAPVVAPDTRLLVLGSLPGARSLIEARYYAHPQNQFWRLMGAVIGVELAPLNYQDRLAALLAARVGLWDVVASASRMGSLDGAMRDVATNDLAALVATLPDLACIGFNGGTAARIGMRQLGGGDFARIPLPSSSPAYTLPFTAKCAAWMALKSYLA